MQNNKGHSLPLFLNFIATFSNCTKHVNSFCKLMLLIAHNATVKCVLRNTLFGLIKSSTLSIVEKLEFNKKVPNRIQKFDL